MTKPVLEVADVSISLGGLKILQDIELIAQRGEVTGVIGPNGAGKTTLFNIVSGFMRPTSGSVRFNGEEIVGRSPEQIAKAGLVRTFQKVRGLPQLTVRENVMIGALNRRRSLSDTSDLVNSLLEKLGLERYEMARVSSLSIGLRKRLEVARVLAAEPQLVLLDEVMGGLVPSEVREMMTLISELASSGVSVILIEHHMRAVMELSNHVVVLDRGINIARGGPETVTKDPTVLTAYLGEGYQHVTN